MTEFASLCVLSFERPIFLAQSLAWLEQNTTFPYELIIHDDGSTGEGVKSILDEQVRKGATVIRNPPGHNQGQGIALNRMFNMAKGNPIVKLDADLAYEPYWLEETYQLMLENPYIGLLGLLHYWHHPADTNETRIDQHETWSEHTNILGSGFALRRETWEDLGPFAERSEAFGEDWMMQTKVYESENWCCALPENNLVNELPGGTMGYGRASLFVEDETSDTGWKIRDIHKEPYIKCRRESLKLA